MSVDHDERPGGNPGGSANGPADEGHGTPCGDVVPTVATSVLDTAVAFVRAGVSVVRAAPDGTKRPDGLWKAATQSRATEAEVRLSLGADWPGFGVITGAVSGGLEMFEFEGRAVVEGAPKAVGELARASGLGELWDRVTSGYRERTPSGGFHFLYRVKGMTVPGNTKLARRPATAAELALDPADRVRTLVETRGEGGFCIVAPSGGSVAPVPGTGWVVEAGGPSTIPTLTADERAELHRLLRTLDAMPPSASTAERGYDQPRSGTRPGDDFAARVGWDHELLLGDWTRVRTRGEVTEWRRPGKSVGISATTGHLGDWLYVFSTSTELPTETAMSKFAAYTALHHGGDYAAAASALRALGYGDPVEGTAGHGASTSDDVATTKADHLRSRLLTSAQLDAIPAPVPLIEGVLWRDTLVEVWGKPASGKSFLGIDWGLCVATGKPWQGHAVTRGRVLYVVGEGLAGIGKRRRAWTYAWGHKTDDGITFLREAVPLLEGAWATALCEVVAAERYDLVVIDTLSRAIPGQAENAPEVMSGLVAAADRLRAAAGGACLLFVHHATKAGDTSRGHSALEGACDVRWEMSKDGGVITLKNNKSKDEAEHAPITLALRSVDLGVDDQGRPVTSAVIEFHRPSSDAVWMTANEEAVLRVMRDLFGTTGAYGGQLKEAAIDGGVPKTSYYRALGSLVSQGKLLNVGTDKRAFYRLPEVEAASS